MKQFVLLLTSLSLFATAFAQDNERPTRSRFWKSKMSTFTVKPGDILVYNVNNGSENQEMLVHVKSFGNTISYNYEFPKQQRKAIVSLDAAAIASGNTYNINFQPEASSVKHSVWLSKKNYTDLAAVGVTEMNFGNGAQQYTRGNTGTLKINYKGKPRIITLFNVSAPNSSNQLGILTEDKNPLIVTLNNGVGLALKEVR